MADGGFSADGGQVLNPDGTVTYDFQGHITAAGVDLTAGNNTAPPDDRKVRWLRQSDRALVAQIYGSSGGNTPNGNQFTLLSEVRADAGDATNILRTVRLSPDVTRASALAQLSAQLSSNGVARTYAAATNENGLFQSVVLIDGNGRSDLAFGNEQTRQPFPFLNRWTDYPGSWRGCAYYKIGSTVFLEGLATGDARTSNVIGLLPVGFRPQAAHVFSTASGEPFTPARVDVYPDGGVVLVAGAGGATSYASLSTIKFSLL